MNKDNTFRTIQQKIRKKFKDERGKQNRVMQEENYLCIYSKFIRAQIFNESCIIANNLINELNKYKLEVERMFDLEKYDEKQKIIQLKKKLKSIQLINEDHLGDLLQFTWETAVLLNDLEYYILSIPFLNRDFDNVQIGKFNEMKKNIMNSTFLTKKILVCFLLDKSNISLTIKKMPNWIVRCENCKNNTNIYKKFSIQIINSIYIEVEKWVNNNMLSISYKKVDKARKHYNCFLYFYDFYQNRDCDNLLNKFKSRMKKEYHL